MENQKIQPSETLHIAYLLALTGGFLDIYTYLLKGQVFATAETGNLILLGVHITQGEWKASISYLFPILSFTIGVMTAESIKNFFIEKRVLHWKQIIILIEILILTLIAFIKKPEFNIIVNSVISFTSSIQIQTFRKVLGNPFASTMCTGNLRSGTEALYFFLKLKEKSFLTRALSYYSIIFCFVTGASLGAFSIHYFAEKALFFAIILLCIVFIRLSEEES